MVKDEFLFLLSFIHMIKLSRLENHMDVKLYFDWIKEKMVLQCYKKVLFIKYVFKSLKTFCDVYNKSNFQKI